MTTGRRNGSPNIRWFETQYSKNCRYANSVIFLGDWKNSTENGRRFEPNGKLFVKVLVVARLYLVYNDISSR